MPANELSRSFDPSCLPPNDEVARERWFHQVLMSAMGQQRSRRRAFIEAACLGHDQFLNTLMSRLDEAESFETNPGDEPEEPYRTHVGPYRIEGELGRGGMGVVYLATREDDFTMQVAVKLVRAGLDSERLLRAFQQERQILASLQHPSIAHIYDGGTTDDGRPYLVMEYVEGMPLNEYLDAHKLDMQECLKLFVKICKAVSFAHQKMVIHRDLKSSNVLITPDGEPKLLDFGIAAFMDPQTRAPLMRTFDENGRMTPEYASPEQVCGERLTAAADVYSLGVILYEMLSGCLPFRFKTTNPLEWQEKICNEEPLKPSAVLRLRRRHQENWRWGRLPAWRRISRDLDAVVAKALAKKINDRYASADALARDIKRSLQHRPVAARPAGLGYSLRRMFRRNYMQIAVFLIISGLALTAWQQRAEAIHERDVADRERRATMDVTEFLNDLFREANPKLNRDKPLTVLEMLDRGIERIESDMNDHPWIRARLYFGMGETFTSFGDMGRAEDLFRKGLALRRSMDIPTDRLLFHLERQLAVALRENGKVDASLDMLLQAARTQKELPVLHKKDAADVAVEIGQAYFSMGWYAEAESAFQKAVQLLDQVQGRDLPRGAAFNGLANICYYTGDAPSQEVYLAAAMENFCRIQNEKPMAYHTLASNHAHLLSSKGSLLRAEVQYRAALQFVDSHAKDGAHPSTVSITEGLMGVLLKQQQADAAEALVHREEGLIFKIWGERGRGLLFYPLTRRAQIAVQRGQFEAALQLFGEVAELVDRGDGRPYSHPDLVKTHIMLHEYDQARALAESAVNYMIESNTAQDPKMAEYQLLLAEIAAHKGQHEEARCHQEQAKVVMTSLGMWDLAWGGLLRVEMAGTALAQGDLLRAARLLDEARPLVNHYFHAGHTAFGKMFHYQAVLLIENGDLDRAVRLLDRSTRILARHATLNRHELNQVRLLRRLINQRLRQSWVRS
ncbi:serine/threonine protein kinase [Acanthopleuribacter pedis]|uniref:Protein kinase n=1 Tax=Acanthopleuribacter pedis TaxID=442870 RepID=A0A8J7Q5Z7_9BACT|nr:serine/threonine-protein kinase [Acanthopleuribacter pedis]MBO1318762.1 protein kinase [Acanthopleuribacter pedis]